MTTKRKSRIIVVGAGIIGATIAYHLARRNVPVTLIDKGKPGADVTARSFGWINVSHGFPEPYQWLRHLAIQDYRRLDRELGYRLPVTWCGALTWNRDPADTERFAREHAVCGYDVRLLERDEIAVLEPNLTEPPALAAFAGSEASVEPTATTRLLADAAREAGAEIMPATSVTSLRTGDRSVIGVITDKGPVDADVVVMAAGTGTGPLGNEISLALPIEASPSVLVHFETGANLVNAIVSSPAFEVRQHVDGHLMAAEDHVEGEAPSTTAEGTLDAIKAGLRGTDHLKIASAKVGMRPIPADDLPIVGFAPGVEGLYVAVMHAGVTLAPAIGRFAAAEILDGVSVKVLDTCRPNRFADAAAGPPNTVRGFRL